MVSWNLIPYHYNVGWSTASLLITPRHKYGCFIIKPGHRKPEVPDSLAWITNSEERQLPWSEPSSPMERPMYWDLSVNSQWGIESCCQQPHWKWLFHLKAQGQPSEDCSCSWQLDCDLTNDLEPDHPNKLLQDSSSSETMWLPNVLSSNVLSINLSHSNR